MGFLDKLKSTAGNAMAATPPETFRIRERK